jgi:uncharacterized protein (DUF433 family)
MAIWPAFTIEPTARVTGLSKHQLERWDRSGFFVPSLADPNRRRPHSRIYSLADLVGLRAIARLLELGVSHRELRQVSKMFADLQISDRPHRKLFVVHRHVYFSRKEAVEAVGSGKTDNEIIVVSLDEVEAEVEQSVKNLSIRSEDQLGNISRDRYIMNGLPVLAGTRIPTSTISRLVEKGYSQQFILREFPRLTVADIDAAVQYEKADDRQASPR